MFKLILVSVWIGWSDPTPPATILQREILNVKKTQIECEKERDAFNTISMNSNSFSSARFMVALCDEELDVPPPPPPPPDNSQEMAQLRQRITQLEADLLESRTHFKIGDFDCDGRTSSKDRDHWLLIFQNQPRPLIPCAGER